MDEVLKHKPHKVMFEDIYCDRFSNVDGSWSWVQGFDNSEVFEAYDEAVEFVESITRAKAVYEKHILLADGDKAIAEKFFRDAYKDNEEVIKAVLGE